MGNQNQPDVSLSGGREYQFELRTNYYQDRSKLSALNRFMRTIFEFDFEEWVEKGFWDSQYVPFSFFQDNTIISNVSLYSMDMVVNGERRKVAQICTCGTLPEYRRRGFAGKLLQKALESAKQDHHFVFLLSNDDVVRFYRSHGFQPVKEFKVSVRAPRVEALPGSVKLDPDNPENLDLISTYAAARAPVSDHFGVLNTNLLIFHCLYGLRDNIYHIPDLDVIVLYKRQKRRLILYDVLGERVPAFSKFYPYLADGRRETVEFLFVPDKMALSRVRPRRHKGNNVHCLGGYPFSKQKVLVPYTARA
ncbi:MAG: GNAT family N-acetyltransferase [Deltaproteobacteria bacterium]|nr:GNAT family N-acetyltransferase [Deltaproteobacteria bacterium]